MSDAKVNMTIPIDEIVHGATVRFTVKDGIQYISIRDIIIQSMDTRTRTALEDLAKNDFMNKRRKMITNHDCDGDDVFLVIFLVIFLGIHLECIRSMVSLRAWIG